MKNRRVLVAVGLTILVLAASSIVLVLTNRPAVPSPSPSGTPPAPIQGTLCFSAEVMTSCERTPANLGFHPGQTINFFVARPFNADGWVHVTVSRAAGAGRVVVIENDYQVIPNSVGVWGEIGTADRLIASGPTYNLGTPYDVVAYMDGKPIAQGSFDLYPNSDPS